jgi:hypothetical protein
LIDSTQSSKSKNHANLGAFNASLYLPDSDTSFISFETPAFKSSDATKVHIEQRVPVQHPEEFIKYCVATFKENTYSYSLQGKGGLKLGGLPKTTVKYDQVVHVAGKRSHIS